MLCTMHNPSPDGQVVVSDWYGNKTYVMNLNWANGSITTDLHEIANVPYPMNLVLSNDSIVIASLVCCQVDHLIKISMFDFQGNLQQEMTHLPSGGRILNPQDVAVDVAGNIILSDQVLGTVVLSPDLSEVKYSSLIQSSKVLCKASAKNPNFWLC